jgi:hypothetical protein
LRRLASLGAAAVVVCSLAGSASAGYTVVSETGPSSNRVKIVFLGDGYTAGQLETDYTQDINAILAHMFNQGEDPFPRYQNFFNVYRIDVVSNESGADDPNLGVYRDTALDASYYWDGGPQRLLYIDESKANAALTAGLVGSGITANMRLVSVNDANYGGGGRWRYGFAVFAGGHSLAGELALHEIGHQFSDLADEYGGPKTYPGGFEPWMANVTASASGEKWARWLGYDDGALGVVGAHEGAMGYDGGIYRPTLTSKMRALNQKFNAVSREKIIQDIYHVVDPLDYHLTNASPLTDPNQLWVKAIDPNVISVNWYVDNVLVPEAIGESFRMEDYGFGAGDYLVSALAFDATKWVLAGKDLLQETIEWEVHLTPEPTVLIVLAVGLMGLRRRGASPCATN